MVEMSSDSSPPYSLTFGSLLEDGGFSSRLLNDNFSYSVSDTHQQATVLTLATRTDR